MREKILTFGPHNGLVGILTEPDESVVRRDAPTIITSDVGMNHRVGPYRIYVELARRLAQSGFSMLRFDLAGMGDSAPRTERVGEIERAVLDVTDAMNALEKRGLKRFVQMGLCSGVDSAHMTTVADSRVVGGIFVEGYAFRTPEFYVRRYLQRPLSKRFWEVYLLRKLRQYVKSARSSAREAGEAAEIYVRAYPTPEQLQIEYAALLARNVQLLFVFSGGMGSDQGYNYEGQFADVFPAVASHPHVDIVYYPEADHIFSVTAHRARLIERVHDWMRARFGA